jgi:hypothetical protein
MFYLPGLCWNIMQEIYMTFMTLAVGVFRDFKIYRSPTLSSFKTFMTASSMGSAYAS